MTYDRQYDGHQEDDKMATTANPATGHLSLFGGLAEDVELPAIVAPRITNPVGKAPRPVVQFALDLDPDAGLFGLDVDEPAAEDELPADGALFDVPADAQAAPVLDVLELVAPEATPVRRTRGRRTRSGHQALDLGAGLFA